MRSPRSTEKRSAKLILELMELPGHWDGYTRVAALENLLVSGVRLSLDEVLRILDPAIQELLSLGPTTIKIFGSSRDA